MQCNTLMLPGVSKQEHQKRRSDLESLLLYEVAVCHLKISQRCGQCFMCIGGDQLLYYSSLLKVTGLNYFFESF